jgi:WD40 repeat protein
MMIVAPPSHFVLAAYADCSARLWSAETGECHMIFGGDDGHQKRVNSAVPSPDGTLVATVSSDCTARLWDASAGKCLYTITGHEKPVNSIAFSPKGTLMVTASEDHTARVWNVETGSPLFVDRRNLKLWYARHANPVTSAVFTHDGESVLTASGDVAVLWDARSSVHRIFQGHEDLVNTAVISPDDTRVLTACNDGRVRLFDARTGVALQAFPSHGSPARYVTFSPIGSQFLIALADRVKICDMTGQCVQSLNLENSVRSAAFSLDGEVVVTASACGSVQLWAADDGECLRELQVTRMGVYSAVFCPQLKGR